MWLQLILFLSLSGLSGSLRAQPVVVDARSTGFELAGHLSASAPQDPTGSAQEALSRYRSGQFEKLPGFLGRGFQRNAVWLAFDLHSTAPTNEFLVLQVGPAYLDHIIAWRTDASGQLSLIGAAGDQVPPDQVLIPTTKPSFFLQLAGGASTTVLLHIQTASQQAAIVKLYRASGFPAIQVTEGLELGFATAAYLTMSIVAFGLYWVLRERIYLFWLALILVMAGQAFMASGMAYRYLNWSDLYHINKLTNGLTVVGAVMMTLFANTLFNFNSLHRGLHHFIIAGAAFALLVTGIAIALTLPMLYSWVMMTLISIMIAAAFGIILQIVKRDPASLHFGPMFVLTFLISTASALSSVSSWVPFSALTASAWQVAGLCNVLALQVAMVSRALQGRRRHEQERGQLLAQLTRQNQELEARVELRTSGLSKAMHDVQKAESSQRQLLAMASHEFRTPAASIKASLDSLVILKDLIAPEVASRLVNMRQASARMIDLANELINEDRLHELALKPHVAALDLCQLVAKVAARYPANTALTVDLPAAALRVVGDAALLAIALGNLIDNALRHAQPLAPQSLRIRLTLQAQNEQVELCVADNGPGIPDNHKQWVFERYHAGTYRDSADSEGMTRTSSGLGLSIVQDIAKAHGGRAFVRDVDPHGAMLVLSLPN